MDTYHTFSFANYYNSKRMNFGALRVIYDDTIEAGEGFGKHPHDNMEIITILLYGDLEHKDSMGHKEVLSTKGVQVMSAGKGLFHSEYNTNADKDLTLFQIWVYPKLLNVEPRYEQKRFDFESIKNKLVTIVSSYGADNSLWVNQDTWFNIGIFDSDTSIEYQLKKR